MKQTTEKTFSKKLLFFLLAIALFPLISGFGSFEDNVRKDRLKYIEKYKDIAISEMERAGIPASIKLAQGILESRQGKSELARKANNHFGMKCGSQWKGKTYHIEDDDYNDNGEIVKSCFRVFKDGEASYIAHSEFLRDPRKAYRYGFLFRLDAMDYKRWAFGLKKAGYATNPKYPDLLIKLIEEYELYVYDKMSPGDVVPPQIDETPDIIVKNLISINDVNIAIAQEDDSVQKIAERTGVSIKRILKYNDHISNATKALEKGTRVMLQPKRWAYRGRKKYHYVQKNQSLFDISQLYAISLSRLRWRNRLQEGQEPAFGQKIKLRGWKVPKKSAPKIRTRADEEEAAAPATIPVLDMEQDPDVEFDPDAAEIDIEDMDIPDAPIDENDGSDGKTDVDDNHTTVPPVVDSPGNVTDEFPTKEDDVIVDGDGDNSDSNDTEIDANVRYHTVLAGETLYRISKMYHTTVKDLKEMNHLNSNILSIGQKLRVE